MIYFSKSVNSFLDDRVWKNLPEDALPITAELHSEIMEQVADGKMLGSDESGMPVVVDQPIPLIENVRANKLIQNNRAYEEAIQLHTSAYPQSEKDTWPTQDKEVKAWAADPVNANTPWIDSAAAARGIDREEYLNRTLSKTIQFEQLSAYLTGLRQRYEDQIKASTTHEQLENIVFNYEI